MADSTLRVRTEKDCDDLFERKLVNEIEGRGFSVVHEPEWCYTVGLWLHKQQPERILFGLPADRAQALLELAAERQELDGLISDLTEQHPLRVLPVQPSHYRQYLPYARWFYRGEGFQARQLVWPDREGRWPDQPDFDPRWASVQPLLDR